MVAVEEVVDDSETVVVAAQLTEVGVGVEAVLLYSLQQWDSNETEVVAVVEAKAVVDWKAVRCD